MTTLSVSLNKFCILGLFLSTDNKNDVKSFVPKTTNLIYLKNSPPIKIVSKYANYNKIDHETNFFEDVELTHLIHKATSENLDISFNNNKASMYKNIVYNKPGTQLTADRLEIDLITKNTKIFMNNKSEKIKIFPSIRFEYFLTLLKYSEFIIGNSSSGIREAPYYNIPTINIGSRQKNRVSISSIYNTNNTKKNIIKLINF